MAIKSSYLIVQMKILFYLFTLFLILFSKEINAQKIEKIFVNLYTDSLKKGTLNYINIDGQKANGQYLPLDTNSIKFYCNTASFIGNSLYIPIDFKELKVSITVTLIQNPAIIKTFDVWIKQTEDPPLKNITELESPQKPLKKKGAKRRG